MTRRSRDGALRRMLLAAVFMVILAFPAAAGARPPKHFYGVTPQVELTTQDFDRMALGRVGTLRFSMPWVAVDNTAEPGDSDWTLIDTVVGSAAVHGMRVLPVFDNVPRWVSDLDQCPSNCNQFAPRGELSLMAWREFIREAVQRYGSEGTFWANNPTVPKKPIRAWQIWNEQNSAQYFSPAPDSDVYARLVTEASNVIKLEDPRAEVVLGGMFLTPNGQRDENMATKFLRRLYAIDGFRNEFDGVAIHPYSGNMRGVRFQAQVIRKVMKNAHDAQTGLWVTELGWSSHHAPKRYYLFVGERRQASLLRRSFDYFTRHRGDMHVKQIDWFSWRDSPPEVQLCLWCPKSGLFTRETFVAKPAWRAYTRFTGGS